MVGINTDVCRNMQRFFYYEKNNTKEVVEILEQLLVNYPKKVYWQHLSAMHGDLKDESKQLAAMETAYVQGMLEKEKTQLLIQRKGQEQLLEETQGKEQVYQSLIAQSRKQEEVTLKF